MRGVRPEHRRQGQRRSLGACRRAIRGAGGFGLLIGLLLSLAAVVEPPRGEARPAGTAAGKVAGSAAAESAAESRLLALLRQHPRLAVAGGVVLALVIADQLVLRLRPRWLLRLPDQGLLLPYGWDMEAQAPKLLPLGWLFGPLKHRDRVLDAWVADHLPTVKNRFLEERATVKERRHHLDTLPVKVNETLETELTPERFRQLEGAVGGLVLISGEGGVGKTSLAVRIATWALAGELTARPVVPVLVEADLRGEETLLSRVRATLADLSAPRGLESGAPTLSLPLARALLERRRLLVILDHYSELSDESRRRLSPGADDFPTAWAIVTSRREEESFAGKVVLHLRPQRLTADRLWPFFSAYLEKVREAEAWDDDLLERAVARLREITAGLVDDQRGITVLLAKLYIDVVVAERRGAGVGVLPASVPALMLTYVCQINAGIEEAERQPRELVVRALQLLAQASEEPLFRPRAVGRETALRALARACAERRGRGAEAGDQPPSDGQPLLDYLVKRLRLVQEFSDGESVHLVLDPLADYLAALGWLRQLAREGESAWDRFLAHTLPARDSEAAALARGFLRALYDCALHAADRAVLGVEVAPERVARLAERAAIDPARLARERERRRQRRLIDDLAEADPAVRLQAIDELCRRRSRDGRVSEALGRVLTSAAQEPAVRQAAAIALAALGGPEAARRLAEVAEALSAAATPHPPAEAVALRRLALEGLGLALAGWREAGASQLAERQRLTRLLEEQLRSDALDLLVSDAAGWAEHDRRLPPLQGAARGLQLAVAPELPLLGAGPGRPVPMLTLSALREGEGLRIRTEVVTPAVWHLPLPELPGAEPQRLELVRVPGGTFAIGSPEGEAGRDVYTRFRQGCKWVNVEAPRTVRLKPFALARHPISQAQWQAVARLPEVSAPLPERPGSHEAKGLWEARAQPGALAVDSVSWQQAQEWLRRLNRWLAERWGAWGGEGEAPRLALPSESQWEVACRAGNPTPFHFGDTLDASWANFNATYAAYGPGRLGPYRQRPVTAGAFGLVNRWGLAELHGQLLEWCADAWHRDPLAGAAGDGSPLEGLDPGLKGHVQQTYKLLRGGSWFIGPRNCRSAYRGGSLPANLIVIVGFRVCCLPPGSLLGP